MKKRLLSLMLAVLLLSSMALPCFAFDDIEGHWAQSYIEQAARLGLFNGVSETEFNPKGTMTRAMFVSVLGRLAQIKPEDWNVSYLELMFTDVKSSAWYYPYVSWAAHHGITNGMGELKFSPNGKITREQMAKLLANFLRIEGYTLEDDPNAVTRFSDDASIAGWAKESVYYLAQKGILTGASDGNGGLLFSPKKNATRAECATLFCRVHDKMVKDENRVEILPTSITLMQSNLQMEPDGFDSLLPDVAPIGVTNPTILWYSTDPNVVSVDNPFDTFTTITAKSPGVAQLYAVTSNRLSAYCTVNVGKPTPIVATGLSYTEKCMLIFGQYVSSPRTYYSSAAQAKPNMVSVSVKVWDINKSTGKKYTRTLSFTVHRNIAPTIKKIFEEIYALPEKPPFHSIGGYRWEYKSEHGVGLALDVNAAENPYVSSESVAYSSGFRPGENPYSIPVGGSVDKIFAKYGFTRGLFWDGGNGRKDYMHYSFFGT